MTPFQTHACHGVRDNTRLFIISATRFSSNAYFCVFEVHVAELVKPELVEGGGDIGEHVLPHVAVDCLDALRQPRQNPPVQQAVRVIRLQPLPYTRSTMRCHGYDIRY